MEDKKTEFSSNSLAYEEALPLDWHILDEALTEEALARINVANTEVLDKITALESIFTEPGELPTSLEQHQDLARIELKLDIVMDMVSQLFHQSLQLPESVPVRLDTESIEWTGTGSGLAENKDIIISLYLKRNYPIPLQLPATVMAIQAYESGVRVSASLQGVSEVVQDQLVKLIFRHHRRSIAHHRKDHVKNNNEDSN